MRGPLEGRLDGLRGLGQILLVLGTDRHVHGASEAAHGGRVHQADLAGTVQGGEPGPDLFLQGRLVGVGIRVDDEGGRAAAPTEQGREVPLAAAGGAGHEHDVLHALDAGQRVLDHLSTLGHRLQVRARIEGLGDHDHVLAGIAEEINLQQGYERHGQHQQQR